MPIFLYKCYSNREHIFGYEMCVGTLIYIHWYVVSFTNVQQCQIMHSPCHCYPAVTQHRWPAVSPNPSAIENVWGKMEWRGHHLLIQMLALQELSPDLVRIWNAIPQSFFGISWGIGGQACIDANVEYDHKWHCKLCLLNSFVWISGIWWASQY